MSRTLGPTAAALWNAGGLGVIVFGVWLALEVDGYELWDGWIVAAIVLWFVGSGAGAGSARACARASPYRPLTAREHSWRSWRSPRSCSSST